MFLPCSARGDSMRTILAGALLILLATVALKANELVDRPKYLPGLNVKSMTARGYIVSLKANEVSSVQFSGNGQTNLALYLFDDEGNCIGMDDGIAAPTCDEAKFVVTPSAAGRYRAVIRNGGFDVNECR